MAPEVLEFPKDLVRPPSDQAGLVVQGAAGARSRAGGAGQGRAGLAQGPNNALGLGNVAGRIARYDQELAGLDTGVQGLDGEARRLEVLIG